MDSVQTSSFETSFVHSNSRQGSYLEVLGANGVVTNVLEIGLYRQPVQPSIRGNEFLGLRVRVGDQEKQIKAEKFVGTIVISKVESLVTNGAEIKHGPVGVEACGEIGWGDLLAILSERNPEYNLPSDNCWEYADSIFRRLIRIFSAHPTISPEKRSELEGFLNHPAPTMPDNVIVPYGSVPSGGAGEGAAAPLPPPGAHPGGAGEGAAAPLPPPGVHPGGVGILDGLRFVASICDFVRAASEAARVAFEVARAASEVAVQLFPPEQLARRFVTRPQDGMHTIAGMQAPAPAALYQILSAPQTIQAVAVAQSLAQTMRRA
ncbi:unnamed protein product [Sphagnum balticum]